MAAFVTYQEALPKAIEQIKANFKLPLPASYIELGVNSFGGYASFFASDVPKIFAEVKDDALQARLKASNAAAIKATQDMLTGYCGTLLTPMAANFNLVPAALLELDDPNGVIRAQVPTALPLLAVNLALMALLVFR